MSQRTHTLAVASRSVPRTAALFLLALAAACSGDRAGDANTAGKEQAARTGAGMASACSKADTTAVALAVLDFIAKATPSAQRYLDAVGTDSALPDDGLKALQDKGPTYFYNSDTTAQRKLRAKLAVDGPWATLLVVYRGQTAADGGIDIRLGGHYVGGEHDGITHPTKRYAVRCDSTTWKIASSAEEPGA